MTFGTTNFIFLLPQIWVWRRQWHPLRYSCLKNPMDGGAWWAAVHGVAKSRTRLSDFTFTFLCRALEKEMATHSRVLAWRIPGTGEPGGLPSMGSHRVGHDWSDLAAAAADLSCHTRDLSLWRVASLVVGHGPGSAGSEAELRGLSCPANIWELNSLTRGRPCIPQKAWWIINTWATREVPGAII